MLKGQFSSYSTSAEGNLVWSLGSCMLLSWPCCKAQSLLHRLTHYSNAINCWRLHFLLSPFTAPRPASSASVIVLEPSQAPDRVRANIILVEIPNTDVAFPAPSTLDRPSTSSCLKTSLISGPATIFAIVFRPSTFLCCINK